MANTPIQLHIEALLFAAQQAISVEEIAACLEKNLEIPMQAGQIESHIAQLIEKYRHAQYSFELVPLGNGYRFLTKQPYHATIATLLNQKNRKRLSTAALETLAIIAYKQPITKTDIEHIRGVNCDYSIQKLLEKELIEIGGRSELPGRPLLYNTTQLFMDYFGINSVAELPKLKEVQPDSDNQIGSQETASEQ
jgi:segregation and condensation protein B